MYRLMRISFLYAVAAMAGGVFYREFTKWNHFTQTTALGKLHTHIFMLGMFFFLFVAVLEKQLCLSEHKNFKKFMYLYNTGLIGTAFFMALRGITEVLALPLSKAADASLSGAAGVCHILLAAGLLFFFSILKNNSLSAQL